MLRRWGQNLVVGLLAVAPLAVTLWAFATAWEHVGKASRFFGIDSPLVGLMVMGVGLYGLGTFVRSVVGRRTVKLVDQLLRRIPGFAQIYTSWREVMVPEGPGMYERVVLVPTAEGHGVQVGFTSGVPLPADPHVLCVYLPGAPNPLSGQLVLVDASVCTPLPISAEEAFKFLLSNGNAPPVGLVASGPLRAMRQPGGGVSLEA